MPSHRKFYILEPLNFCFSWYASLNWKRTGEAQLGQVCHGNFWVAIDRSHSFFYFVPQENNLTVKQARLGGKEDLKRKQILCILYQNNFILNVGGNQNAVWNTNKLHLNSWSIKSQNSISLLQISYSSEVGICVCVYAYLICVSVYLCICVSTVYLCICRGSSSGLDFSAVRFQVSCNVFNPLHF